MKRLLLNYPLVYKVLIGYSVLTLILFFWIPWTGGTAFSCLFPRFLVFAFPPFLMFLSEKLKWFKTNYSIVLQMFPFILLGFFYSETALINTIFTDFKDVWFFTMDERIFGFQPSIEFSKVFSANWFSELMCFGYISYYFIVFGIPILCFTSNKESLSRNVFIIITSFLIYYLIFIFLPVEGPQFYFPFPDNKLNGSGFFHFLLQIAHDLGEGTTGAFPSSHVGVAFICLILLFKYSKRWLLLFLPLTLILCLSTVYIKAHYFVDVLGGIISAPVFYVITNRLYSFYENKSLKYASRN